MIGVKIAAFPLMIVKTILRILVYFPFNIILQSLGGICILSFPFDEKVEFLSRNLRL